MICYILLRDVVVIVLDVVVVGFRVMLLFDVMVLKLTPIVNI